MADGRKFTEKEQQFLQGFQQQGPGDLDRLVGALKGFFQSPEKVPDPAKQSAGATCPACGQKIPQAQQGTLLNKIGQTLQQARQRGDKLFGE